MHRVRSWQLTCPDSSQWNLRAKGFCNITKPTYYCLFDANSLHYKDFCRDKQDFHKPGHKYIIRGDIDGEPCEENRYQPFKFRTDGNNKCIFGKSVCNEEGQIVQNTGNTTTDTSCRCDYTNGYGFVVEPTRKCFCHPTQEDCSCYKKKCSNNEFLNPIHQDKLALFILIDMFQLVDYECGTHLIGDFDCPKIKTNRLNDHRTVDSAVQIKPAIPASSSLDIHNQHIDDWVKDDSRFIVTTATQHIIESLKRVSCVFVVGHAGNGKSSIIRHIALKLRKQEQYEIIPIVMSPEIIFEFLNRNRKQIFIVDDFCGKVNINAQYVDLWFSQINDIVGLIKTSDKSDIKHFEVKFLFATSLSIYEDNIFQKSKLLMKYVFSLSNWTLTDDEKLKMINKYITPEGESKLLQKLKSDVAYFPLLCKIAERKTPEQIINLFSNLKGFIKQDLMALKEKSHLQFCTITLCALLSNNLKEEILNGIYESDIERQAFENICLEFNLGSSKDQVKSKIKAQLANLEGMYMTKTENYYHFIHAKVYHIAVVVCGQTYLHSFIKFVRSSFIAERFCFQSRKKNNNKNTIFIDNEDAENRFFDRLMIDLEKGETYSTFHNNQLTNRSYREKFCEYCRTRTNKVSELLKHFSVKSEINRIAERNYDDYIDFQKQHHFFSHKMRRPLIESAWEGYADIVRLLLECGCNINESDIFGRTALFVACLLGKTEVVTVLLDYNADHSLCDENGQSPLLVASREGHGTIIETLLQNNADVNKSDVEDNSPLLEASSKCYLSTVETLSKKITDFPKCNKLGQTPVFVACKNGGVDVVRYLLSFLIEYISTPDNEGRSPLFIACRKGHYGVVELLLENNADVSRCDRNKQSPLFIASDQGYNDIVNILIQNNAKINQCDEEGKTPLFAASEKARTETAKILVDSGADLNEADNEKRTPLYAACKGGFIDIVTHLVENGSSVSNGDLKGTTPLLVAIKNGNTEIAQFLINRGVDINQSDQHKKDPVTPFCRWRSHGSSKSPY
ncbi:unnamed protein product [Mytilus coruscus]|uniref:Novel STAND NTPase 3 domain-containing protein n=1 Tax=Mytilus coruscus TaxID=42192 RepID=A0A6J7ZUY2_MYTCO|nr:unnamed protein product [Mytilus coruscus]